MSTEDAQKWEARLDDPLPGYEDIVDGDEEYEQMKRMAQQY